MKRSREVACQASRGWLGKHEALALIDAAARTTTPAPTPAHPSEEGDRG